jgi:hypothetical protein
MEVIEILNPKLFTISPWNECLIMCKFTCSYGVLFVGLQALNWIPTLPGTHH